MSAADDDLRSALVDGRASALARLAALRGQVDDVVDASAGSNADDEHDPEGATIAFERAQLTALARQAQAAVEAADAALARLEAGTYGVCARCGARIAPERLAARPTTPWCLACAAVAGR